MRAALFEQGVHSADAYSGRLDHVQVPKLEVHGSEGLLDVWVTPTAKRKAFFSTSASSFLGGQLEDTLEPATYYHHRFPSGQVSLRRGIGGKDGITCSHHSAARSSSSFIFGGDDPFGRTNDHYAGGNQPSLHEKEIDIRPWSIKRIMRTIANTVATLVESVLGPLGPAMILKLMAIAAIIALRMLIHAAVKGGPPPIGAALGKVGGAFSTAAMSVGGMITAGGVAFGNAVVSGAEGFGNAMVAGGEAIGKGMSIAGEKIGEGFGKAGEGLSKAGEKFGEGLGKAGENIGKGFDKFSTGIGMAWDHSMEGLGKVGMAMKHGWKNFTGMDLSGLAWIGRGMKEGLAKAGENIGKGFKAVGRGMKHIYENASLKGIGRGLKAMKDGIVNAASAAWSGIEHAGKAMLHAGGKAIEHMRNAGKGMWNAMKAVGSALGNAYETLDNAVKAMGRGMLAAPGFVQKHAGKLGKYAMMAGLLVAGLAVGALVAAMLLSRRRGGHEKHDRMTEGGPGSHKGHKLDFAAQARQEAAMRSKANKAEADAREAKEMAMASHHDAQEAGVERQRQARFALNPHLEEEEEAEKKSKHKSMEDIMADQRAAMNGKHGAGAAAGAAVAAGVGMGAAASGRKTGGQVSQVANPPAQNAGAVVVGAKPPEDQSIEKLAPDLKPAVVKIHMKKQDPRKVPDVGALPGTLHKPLQPHTAEPTEVLPQKDPKVYAEERKDLQDTDEPEADKAAPNKQTGFVVTRVRRGSATSSHASFTAESRALARQADEDLYQETGVDHHAGADVWHVSDKANDLKIKGDIRFDPIATHGAEVEYAELHGDHDNISRGEAMNEGIRSQLRVGRNPETGKLDADYEEQIYTPGLNKNPWKGHPHTGKIGPGTAESRHGNLAPLAPTPRPRKPSNIAISPPQTISERRRSGVMYDKFGAPVTALERSKLDALDALENDPYAKDNHAKRELAEGPRPGRHERDHRKIKTLYPELAPNVVHEEPPDPLGSAPNRKSYGNRKYGRRELNRMDLYRQQLRNDANKKTFDEVHDKLQKKEELRKLEHPSDGDDRLKNLADDARKDAEDAAAEQELIADQHGENGRGPGSDDDPLHPRDFRKESPIFQFGPHRADNWYWRSPASAGGTLTQEMTDALNRYGSPPQYHYDHRGGHALWVEKFNEYAGDKEKEYAQQEHEQLHRHLHVRANDPVEQAETDMLQPGLEAEDEYRHPNEFKHPLGATGGFLQVSLDHDGSSSPSTSSAATSSLRSHNCGTGSSSFLALTPDEYVEHRAARRREGREVVPLYYLDRNGKAKDFLDPAALKPAYRRFALSVFRIGSMFLQVQASGEQAALIPGRAADVSMATS